MKNISVSNEDYEFLKNLAIELKTQDNMATRKPLVFKIQEDETIVGFNQDYSCEPCIVDKEGNLYTTTKEFKEQLEEDYGMCFEDICKSNGIDIDVCNIDNLYELYELVKEIENDTEYTYTYYKKYRKYSGEFLTMKAIKQHINQNGYHYNNPKIYIDHAWRNPEFERLLSIIENIK